MTRNTLEQRSSSVRNHIKPFLGNRKLTELTGPMIQIWVDELKANGRKSTSLLKTAVSILRLSIADAQRYGLVGRNIVKELPPDLGPKREKPVAIPHKEQIRRIMSVVASSPRERIIVELAVFTGMRLGEILGLDWKSVNFDRKLISVKYSADKWKEIGAPKTFNGYRDLPVPSGLLARLRELRGDAAASDTVIRTLRGTIMSQTEWQSWFWPKILRKAGLDDKGGTRLVTHSLRHFAASLYIEAGLPPKRVQYLMRHSSIQMTFDRYGHLFPDGGESARAIESIERSFAGRDENATLAA